MNREQAEAIRQDPKTFLLRGRKAKELIAAKNKRIDEWRRMAVSATVPIGNDSGGPSTYKQSIVENTTLAIVDLLNEITIEIAELAGLEREIQDAITQFVTDDRYKAVLELRYLNGYSWRAIGNKLYYGEDWVCRLHGAALRQMKESAEKYLS